MGCASSATLQQACRDFNAEYDLKEVIGSGAFAKVHACTERKTKQQLAVKALEVGNGTNRRTHAKREAELWHRLSGSKHCVRLHGFFEQETCCYIVMERCQVTLLQAWLSTNSINEEGLVHAFRGMLRALQDCHALGIVHRDIKAENFMVSDKKFTKDSSLKLCDFGLATQLPTLRDTDDSLPIERKKCLKGVYGTAPYMAPEMLTDAEKYGCGVDIWAFGVTAYLLLFGNFPFVAKEPGPNAMMDVIRKGIQVPTYAARRGSAQPSTKASAFLSRILIRNQATRPTATQLLMNAYVAPSATSVDRSGLPASSPKTSTKLKRLESEASELGSCTSTACFTNDSRRSSMKSSEGSVVESAEEPALLPMRL